LIITLALPNLDKLSRNNRRELARYGPKATLEQFEIVQTMDRQAGMLVLVHPETSGTRTGTRDCNLSPQTRTNNLHSFDS